MGRKSGYKKYMKKDVKKEHPLWQIFILSFLGMLLVFTFLIKSFSPSVDTTIGESQNIVDIELQEELKKNSVNDTLAMIQNEDQGRNFSELMANADDVINKGVNKGGNIAENFDRRIETKNETAAEEVKVEEPQPQVEPIYKVFVGAYTSVEQAKVAKDIIQESGIGLNPIVKCIGTNNYTLQVGIFKNKQSADSLLYTVQQAHLPGRIVQEY